MESNDATRLREMIEEFMIAVPRVLREAIFRERAKKGEGAEDIVFRWLEQYGAKVFRFRYRADLSKEDLPREVKRWLETLPEPPDAIVRAGDLVYFADVKYKSEEYWAVNVTDYRHYHEISQVLPVKVYFLIGPKGKIYVHTVTDPESFETKIEWNGNTVYIIPTELIKEVATVHGEMKNEGEKD